MNSDLQVDVSIIIVNYNVKHFAEQCLKSIYASGGNLNLEVFIVDNASEDGSVEYLERRFSNVIIIVNSENIGFGRANNIALSRAKGKYILILNPDTLLGEDSLAQLVGYMESHPRAGAIGPKILTRYGGFDVSSKRGLPTPWVAFTRISGLSRFFPRSRLFGKYDLLYLDPDQPAEVDSLVGSCMMIRSNVYSEVGGFDEDFFMYGEDIDWCYRIMLAGWEIHYAPVTKIVHFRGESTRRSNIDRDKAFYGAMHLFVDKHFKSRYSRLGHLLINSGIIIAKAATRLRPYFGRTVWVIVDWIGFWGIMALARWLRWGEVGINTSVGIALSIQATVWVGVLAALGVYGSRRGNNAAILTGLSLGFLINSSFTYFFKQFAYSRFVTLFAFIIGGLFIWGWRRGVIRFTKTKPWQDFSKRRALIIGTGRNAQIIGNRLKTDKSSPYLPVGFIDPSEEAVGSLLNELPVLGSEEDIERLLRQEKIEEVLFAYDQVDYNKILDLLSHIGKKNKANFKVITPDLIDRPDGSIPLLSLDYLMPRGVGRSLRRFTTTIFKRQ